MFDGSEDWQTYTPTGYGLIAYCSLSGYLKENAITTICDYYKSVINTTGSTDTYTKGNNTISVINSSSFDRIYLRDDTIQEGSTGLYNFKSRLSTNNITLYYVLSTPTYTLLNNTLQTELDNIAKALSYKDQTNISQTNNDLPFTISASAIRDMSNIFSLIEE